MTALATFELISLNVGAPRTLTSPDGATFVSSIDRTPTAEPQHCSIDGLPGDSCEYRYHHNQDRAINVFDLEDYTPLLELLDADLPIPSFGENLTTRGLPGTEARVGDRLRVGDALLEISHPREPCGNITRLHGAPRLVKWMRESNITGYYCRVIEEGVIGPDSEITLIERGLERWTIEALDHAMFHNIENEETGKELMNVAPLSIHWKRSYAEQYNKRTKRELTLPE